MYSKKFIWVVVVIMQLGAVLPAFAAKLPKRRKAESTETFLVPSLIPQGTRTAEFRYTVNGGVCPSGHGVSRPDNIYICDHIEPNNFAGGSISFTVMTDTGTVLLTQSASPGFQTFPVFCNAPPGTAPPPLVASGGRTFDVSGLTASADANLILQITVVNNGCGPGVQSYSLGPASVANYSGGLTIEGSFAVQQGDLQNVGATATTRVRPMAITSPANETIHVPLGLPFKWGMFRKTTPPTPIPCDFALSIFEQNPLPVDDQRTYPLRTTILFADRVLLPFGTTTPVNTKEFVGIHLGTQYFTATPSDTSIPAVTIRVDVLSPTTLGSRPFDVDDEITEVANRRGIPPQWIKGHVMKEADTYSSPFFWRRDSFRYEPISSDLREVSRNDELRAVLPFSRYRMETQNNDPPPSGLARGISLDVPDDVSFRDQLFINRGGTVRNIVTSANPAVNDNDVTAREIVDANPGQGWARANRTEFLRIEAARLAGNDPLTFNAQTTLASSYGLLQPMYCNAVRFANWKDPYGPGVADIHPRFLVDSPANLQQGDGSLHVATVQLLFLLGQAGSGAFQRRYGVAPYRIDSFDSFADFKAKWQTALQFYNIGATGYAAIVMSNADNYVPTRIDTGIQP